MHGIFIAKGSMFKTNYFSNQAIENIDIQPLICWILKIECNKNVDGSLKSFIKYLRFSIDDDESFKPVNTSLANYCKNNAIYVMYICLMFSFGMGSILCISICRTLRMRKEFFFLKWSFTNYLNKMWKVAFFLNFSSLFYFYYFFF